MFQNKPIIGIVGGIGSGKSFVADLFGEMGCLVIKADDLVHQAYQRPELKEKLRAIWGDQVITADGLVDRKLLAQKVFGKPGELKQLEQMVHPLVGQTRDQMMARHAADPAVKAFIWDIPLLFEVGLDKQCDAVVFVDAPQEIRLQRVCNNRHWNQQELIRREILQMGLDKKRSMAQYVVANIADSAFARRQVEAVISRILIQA